MWVPLGSNLFEFAIEWKILFASLVYIQLFCDVEEFLSPEQIIILQINISLNLLKSKTGKKMYWKKVIENNL